MIVSLKLLRPVEQPVISLALSKTFYISSYDAFNNIILTNHHLQLMYKKYGL